ncbi:MAG: acyltransferase family protein, partial [Acidimicrobiales bacterium]
PTTVGIPIPGGSFELAPVDGRPPDEGELVYRGDNVMLGYADGPEALALGGTIDALRTGDIARRTPEGLYEIVGRRSRFAKIFGLRIDLDHLEHLLLERSVVATCTTDDHRLIVAVTGAADVDRARAVLRVETGLPAARLLVEHLPELPRLGNGKADHTATAAAVVEAADRATHAAELHESADVDPGVLRAFAAVFPRPEITADATFVDLGGDSLSYVEVSLALEERLGELPSDWHTTPIGKLVPATASRPRLRQMETSVVLRAVSIVLVVGTHIKLFTVLGGAHLLLGVAGYNFARFQGLPSDRLRSIARIAVPSMVWLAIASTINPRIHLSHVLLLNGWLGGDDAHGGYWYVEAIVQILVPLALVLSVPAVRRLDRSHRAVVPLAVLAAGLLVRFHVVDLPTVEPHDIRPHDIFWIFALGWVAAEARTTAARVAVSALLVGSVPGYFGEPAREVFVVAGMLLLIWLPTVRLPRVASRVVGSVAAASLYVYLTHWQVFPPLLDASGPVVALVGSIAAGVGLWTLIRFATKRTGRWRQDVGSRSGTSGAPSWAASPSSAAPL